MNTTAPTTDIPATEEIRAFGYSPRFVRAVRDVLKTEGGFVDDPKDRGGATHYGISLRFLVSEGRIDLDQDGRADFDLDGDGDIDGRDIRLLTRGGAVFLYWRCFWQPLQAEGFAAPLGEMLFDQAVNAGIGSARRLLQQALNHLLLTSDLAPPKLAVDGAIGHRTLVALNWVLMRPGLGMAGLIAAYRNAVKLRYKSIVRANPSQKRFLNGWLARADRLGRV